jgi:hypothetical protein
MLLHRAPGLREQPFDHELIAHSYRAWVINVKRQDSRSSYRRQADEFWTFPCEMVGPIISARTKEANNFASDVINARNVWALLLVASKAAICKV